MKSAVGTGRRAVERGCRAHPEPGPRGRSIRKEALIAAILYCLASALAQAGPPNVSVSQVEAIDKPSPPGETYNPADPLSRVYFEEVAAGGKFLFPTDRLNMDISIMNNEPITVRLRKLIVSYPNTNHPEPLTVEGHDLLALPDDLFDPGGPAPGCEKRSALANGGWGVTGARIEHKVVKEEFDRAGQVFDATGFIVGKSYRTFMVGERTFLVGDGPDATTATQGWVAKFDSGGNRLAGFHEAVDSVDAVKPASGGRLVMVGTRETYGGQGETIEHLVIMRRRVAEKVDGVMTELGTIEIDDTFGDITGSVAIEFKKNGTVCEGARAIDIEVFPGTSESYLALAGLTCQGVFRVGLAKVTAKSALDPNFGEGGTVVVDGPGGSDAEPVGLERLGGVGLPTVYVGALVEGACGQGGDGCGFGLARLGFDDGEQDESFGNNDGWAVHGFPGAAASAPNSMKAMTTPLGKRILFGGWADAPEQSFALLAFTDGGQRDQNFGPGLDGRLLHMPGGFRGAVYDVLALSSGNIAVTGLVQNPDINGLTPSFATAVFDPLGTPTPLWERSTWDRWWLHSDIDKAVTNGSLQESRVSSIAHVVVEDDQGRILAAGMASSDLVDPDAGPQMIASARYLPDGLPDDRRSIRPGAFRRILVPEDRSIRDDGHGGLSAIKRIVVELHFQGYSDPVVIDRNLRRYQQSLPEGAYLFPFDNDGMGKDRRWVVTSGHGLAEHHRPASTNRFAYDLALKRWDGSGWTGNHENEDGDENEERLSWGQEVRAMAYGSVVDCRIDRPDNPEPGPVTGKANFIKIKHHDDLWDDNRDEIIRYFHFQQNTIPADLCPLECPDDLVPCDLDKEGVIKQFVPVEEGQYIGKVGNSGNSDSPHLHIDLVTAQSQAGNRPLLFRNLLVINKTDSEGNQQNPPLTDWIEVDGSALRWGLLIYPE